VVGSSRKQHRGGEDERHRQVQPAAHAARVVLHRLAPGVGQAEALEELVGAPAGGRLVEPVEPAEKDEVLAAAEDLVDGGLLAAQPDPAPHLVRGVNHVGAGDGRPAGIGPQQRRQDAHRRGLAGTVRPEQAADGAGRDGKVEPIQGRRVAVALHQARRLDAQLRSSHRPPPMSHAGFTPYVVRSKKARYHTP
jgi:hypothetical protein